MYDLVYCLFPPLFFLSSRGLQLQFQSIHGCRILEKGCWDPFPGMLEMRVSGDKVTIIAMWLLPAALRV